MPMPNGTRLSQRRAGRSPRSAAASARGEHVVSTPAHARYIWIDGALAPADARHLSAFDRGFQLGDGIFETLRARGGHPTELAQHLGRLRRSADGLDIQLAASIEADLARGIRELL